MAASELFRIGARAALARMEGGDLDPMALWTSCKARIAEVEPEVGAFKFLNDHPRAARVPATGNQGLAHLPVGIKDIIDTIDMPTSYGSPIYADYRPPRDAYVVARLKRAGAIIAGKTETTEFAGPSPARTRNPRKLSASPGGSSAGSAAAVASGMIPLSLGTQTAGSVIRPAAYCGIVGFKPSLGLIDTTGIRTAAASLDTVGMFARHVEDIALLTSFLAEDPGFGALRASDTPLRIGLWRSAAFSTASGASQASFDEAAGIFEGAGLIIFDIEEDTIFAKAAKAAELILAVETARSTASEMLNAPDAVSAILKATIANGERTTSAELAEARNTILLAAMALDEKMAANGIDVLLTLAAADEAPEGLASTGDPGFSRIWTAFGVPVITLPQTYGPRGLPIGIQLIARRGHDSHLLRASLAIEAIFRRQYGEIFAVP